MCLLMCNHVAENQILCLGFIHYSQGEQVDRFLFQEGKIKIACRQYGVVVKMLEGYFDSEELKKTNPIKLAGHLNMAACQLKLGNNQKCIKECEKVSGDTGTVCDKNTWLAPSMEISRLVSQFSMGMCCNTATQLAQDPPFWTHVGILPSMHFDDNLEMHCGTCLLNITYKCWMWIKLLNIIKISVEYDWFTNVEGEFCSWMWTRSLNVIKLRFLTFATLRLPYFTQGLKIIEEKVLPL